MQIAPATFDDVDSIATLRGITASALRREWAANGTDGGPSGLVARRRGELLGYAAVAVGGAVTLVGSAPDIERGLLDRLLPAARSEGHRMLLWAGPSGSEPPTGPDDGRCFEPIGETLVMSRDLADTIPPVSLPAGVTLRTFEPADAIAVHGLLDGAYGAWDSRYVPMTHEAWVTSMTEDSEFDPSVWWLAEHDDRLVGCSLHWSSGWLKDIAVHASERGRGTGYALLDHGLTEFKRRGVARVGLKVDAANPTGAIRLYERIGFVTERRESRWALTL